LIPVFAGSTPTNLRLTGFTAGVSKRNIAYMLDQKVPNLWIPGIPRSTRGQADEFIKVRTGGIPAGARKLYVTIEVITSNGLLCSMPGVTTLPKMNAVLDNIRVKRIAAHVGASYYLHETGKKPFRVEQNLDEYKTVTVCAGTYTATCCTQMYPSYISCVPKSRTGGNGQVGTGWQSVEPMRMQQ